MTIPIQPVSINPGSTGLGPQQEYPDLGSTFIQAYLGAKDRKQRASQSSAEIDIKKQELALQMGHLKFQQEQEKTRQAQIAHQQELLSQQGVAFQQFAQFMSPQQAQQAFPQLIPGTMSPFQQGQPQGGLPQSPFQQAPQAPQMDPMQALGQIVQGMPTQAAPGFVESILPMLQAMQKGGGGAGQQAVQTGDTVTTFVPGKGFWNPQANGGQGGYVPSIERGMTADEKESKAQDRELRALQIQNARDQAVQRRATTQTNQFNSRTKGLRERGALIDQTLMTLDAAQNDPNPANRRVLMSSAIANFVQAADQKAQLRYQLLNYFKSNADPSLKGRLDIVATRLAKGTYPDYIYEGLAAHVKQLKALARSEYDKQRVGEVKRHPDLENWLPDTDEFFAMQHPSMAAPDQGGLPPLPPLP